jgi:Tol biopolymer transport system component
MMDRIAKPLLTATILFLASPAMSQGKPEAILRTEGPMVGIRLNKKHTQMAFTDQKGQSLRIMDLATQEITEVTPHRVGEAFFWSPDGNRLFYRELVRDKKEISSEIRAYDTYLSSNASIDSLSGSSGYLTLDPRDYTVYVMHEKGIMSKRLNFPGERFARWQKRAKVDQGRFVATQKSVLWLSDLGLTLNALPDDGSGVESFDISPDGKVIAWATQSAHIYMSNLGETPKLLGRGKDPRWHPQKSLLLFSGAREVGSKIYDYDVRITDTNGQGRFLTNSPEQAERWPQWWDNGTIIFTADKSTDLWKMTYQQDLAKTVQAEPSDSAKL